jgi:hypothetical protein
LLAFQQAHRLSFLLICRLTCRWGGRLACVLNSVLTSVLTGVLVRVFMHELMCVVKHAVICSLKHNFAPFLNLRRNLHRYLYLKPTPSLPPTTR